MTQLRISIYNLVSIRTLVTYIVILAGTEALIPLELALESCQRSLYYATCNGLMRLGQLLSDPQGHWEERVPD